MDRPSVTCSAQAVPPPRTSRGLRRLGAGLAALTLLVSLGCQGPDGGGFWRPPERDDEAEVEQATPVVTGTVARGPITASVRASSTIEAERQVTVHAEATGRILELSLEEGDTIERGQQLARIKYDAQLGGLDRATTSLSRVKADYETVKKLHARGVASKEELDAARLSFDTAKLDVKDRRRDVRNTRVRAPFGGTVTERFVAEGAFVASGAQILSVTDMDTLVARVYVPEKELDRIRVGQPAQISGKAAKGRQGVGSVKRIAPIVDATTGTVKVTIALPRELAGGERGFLPGMYAEVTMTTERRDTATLVAKEALVRDDDVVHVFVLDGDRVTRKPLTLGLSDGGLVEVVSGLGVGDEIVVAGHAGLKDGALIRRVDRNGETVAGPDGDSPGLADGTMGNRAPQARPAEGA